MSSDWWSRKLTGTPAPQRTSFPPSSPPIRIGQQVTYPQEQQQRPHNENLLDPNKGATDEIHMSDAIRMWKGGEAMRREGSVRCPDCGSQHVFSRTGRSANTSIQGKAPAPRCFECGWTGLYTQASESNWAV